MCNGSLSIYHFRKKCVLRHNCTVCLCIIHVLYTKHEQLTTVFILYKRNGIRFIQDWREKCAVTDRISLSRTEYAQQRGSNTHFQTQFTFPLRIQHTHLVVEEKSFFFFLYFLLQKLLLGF